MLLHHNLATSMHEINAYIQASIFSSLSNHLTIISPLLIPPVPWVIDFFELLLAELLSLAKIIIVLSRAVSDVGGINFWIT